MKSRSGSGRDDSEDVPFKTQWSDFAPAFTPDGSGVYFFFSNQPGGEGGDDAWFVPVKSDALSEPVNIGTPVNTPGNEWAPRLGARPRCRSCYPGLLFFSCRDPKESTRIYMVTEGRLCPAGSLNLERVGGQLINSFDRFA